MAANKTIRQMLEAGEFIWAPCVYDCTSARAVELCGYNAILLSSSELEFSMNGIPGGLYNWEEYIWATGADCGFIGAAVDRGRRERGRKSSSGLPELQAPGRGRGDGDLGGG